uniref:Uncharacterized protein n=1 Tax=uncultured prokaryote TaxID=198431 RepID=A0A0H5Q4X4_9ZZZZ|nr:hypothetical protein [uncultured prokaryote]
MAINYPGPYELRIFYDTQLTFGAHVMKLNLDLDSDPEIGAEFEDISTENHDASTTPLNSLTEALLTVLAPLFQSTTDFPLVELWSYAAGTFDATFRAAYDPVVSNGSAGTAIPAGQAIITFRTAGGGIAKLSLMESNLTAGPDQSFPTASTPINNLASFMTVASRPWLGRDNTRFLVPKAYFPGQNEALWKKYNRTSS